MTCLRWRAEHAALAVLTLAVLTTAAACGGPVEPAGPASAAATPAAGTAEVTVLVSDPTQASMQALLSGRLRVLRGCLGVGDSVVVWPPGTSTDSGDSLRITIPNLGSYGLGDDIELGGGYAERPHEGSQPWQLDTMTVPEGCGETVFLAGPILPAPPAAGLTKGNS